MMFKLLLGAVVVLLGYHLARSTGLLTWLASRRRSGSAKGQGHFDASQIEDAQFRDLDGKSGE
jgi:hypothetical protein